MKRLLLLPLLLSGVLCGDTKIAPAAKDLQITIYNNNLAFIDEKREVKVAKGEQRLVYEDVASQVVTPSVIPVFSGADVKLYSQNYIYNLISQASLLEYSVGKRVLFYPNGKEKRPLKGILLAASPVVVRVQNSGSIVTLESPTQVIFPKVPDSMITRPSLVWHVDISKSATLGIDLMYLSRGIGWKSDYVFNLKENRLDLSGWITVKNDSGKSYKNAKISCIAGALHRVAPKVLRTTAYDKMMAQPAPVVREEAFGGYHLYTIPFRESIEDKSQKQILFIEKKGIGYSRYGEAKNSYFENYGKQKLQFTQIVTFTNSVSNHAGVALPGGTVRMYEADSRGEAHFVGEDAIANTPAGETVKLRVGTLFDVVGEKRITRFISNKHHREVETTYEVRNRGKKQMEVRLDEQIPTYGENITHHSSCKGNCKEIVKNAFVREFRISLDPKSVYRFTSAFEVVY